MNFTNRINIRTSLCVRIRTCTRTRIRTRNVSRIGHSFSIHISLIGGTRIRGRTRSMIIRMRRRTRSCLTIASREYYDTHANSYPCWCAVVCGSVFDIILLLAIFLCCACVIPTPSRISVYIYISSRSRSTNTHITWCTLIIGSCIRDRNLGSIISHLAMCIDLITIDIITHAIRACSRYWCLS